MIDAALKNYPLIIEKAPLAFGLFSCVLLFAYRKYQNLPNNSDDWGAVFFAGAGIPTGIFLILAAFGALDLREISSLDTYLGFSGIGVLYFSCTSIHKKFFIASKNKTIGDPINYHSSEREEQ